MESETTTADQKLNAPISTKKSINRLKVLGVVFTVLGIGLFSYFIYAFGFSEILAGIAKIGFGGFAIILFIYFLRLAVRAASWRLTVQSPYKLDFRDTFPAVVMGEALSSIIPLGILISGTAKAIAVRRRVPLVIGFSSVATENLFYSLITGIFISAGAFLFLRLFEIDPAWTYLIDFFVGFIIVAMVIVALMVIRQWHWASSLCEWFYNRGFFPNLLSNGRKQIRIIENQIYGFYRKYPQRFLPLCLMQVLFHSLGIFEVWFILSRIGESFPAISTAFYLESMSRLITIVFKLVPFLVGVDEAGAEFIVETLAAGVGIGVTLAIIRKGRTLFWAVIGVAFIAKRGLSIRDIREIREVSEKE